MLKLEIVTPEKRVLDTEVDSVTVPTASGEAGIYPQHAPLVSALKPGVLSYSIKGHSDRLAVSGGFVEVNSDKVAVLVDTAETPDEIDSGAAAAARAAAEQAISTAGSVTEEEAARQREVLEHAQARTQLASAK